MEDALRGTGETGYTGDKGLTGLTGLTGTTVLSRNLTEIKPKMVKISYS